MIRNTLRFTLALLVVGVAGCQAPEAATAPDAAVVVTQTHLPSNEKSDGLGGLIVQLGKDVDNSGKQVTKTLAQTLACLLPDTIAVDIGPNGGTVTLGSNSLSIPRGSLKNLTHIIMLPLPGTTPAVAFFPEGLLFATNAQPTLTFDTQCIGNPWNATIVYTDDLGNVKETKDSYWSSSHTLSAKIGHFSRYAVAW